MPQNNLKDIKNLISLIRKKYGLDLGIVSAPVFKLKINRVLSYYNFTYIDSLISKLNTDPDFHKELIYRFFQSDIELFRDFRFWLFMKEKVLPGLQSISGRIKISFCLPCAPGDIISTLILLNETQKLDDIDIRILNLIERSNSLLNLGDPERYTLELSHENIKKVLPEMNKHKYFSTDLKQVEINPELLRNVIFEAFDFGMENSFPSDIIVCRNTLINFNLPFQNQLVSYLSKNLLPNGRLILGYRENISHFLSKNNSLIPDAAYENVFYKKNRPNNETLTNRNH